MALFPRILNKFLCHYCDFVRGFTEHVDKIVLVSFFSYPKSIAGQNKITVFTPCCALEIIENILKLFIFRNGIQEQI